ncbi:MAG: hypothetical protein KC609_22640, partial [Myxococcales bacterium]|nr:hypothetical protein [Myxococcales bacterium]
LRSSFLAGRHFTTIDELRRAFATWRDEVSNRRRCRANRELSVGDALAEERVAMLPLPSEAFPVALVRAVVARKQPYVLLDTNAYSIPVALVGRALTLRATEERVQVYDGSTLVADHLRLWCRDATSEQREHLEGYAAAKERGHELVGRSRLLGALPSSEPLLARLAEKDVPLGPQVRQLLTLLDLYGDNVMERAITIALERDTPHAASLAGIIERLVKPGRAPAPLPDTGRPEVDELTIKQHNLEDYDAI